MLKPIYLDYAAATPCDEQVLASMQPYFSERFYNPSASYEIAQDVRRDVDAARVRVAHWLGCRREEFIYTAGGTEANNLAIHGVMRSYTGGNCVVSGVEHDAVLAPAGQYDRRIAPVDEAGRIKIKELTDLIDDNTTLVSIMYVSNEIGTIQPLRDIAEVVRAVRQQRKNHGINRPILLHTDASQAANYLDLHIARLGVDMMTLNGGKMYGPKQSGGLYVHRSVLLKPLLDGGGQEQSIRSGTENVPFIIGFSQALDGVQSMRHHEVERLTTLQRQLIDGVLVGVPEARLNGSIHHRVVNNAHFTFPGHLNEVFLLKLEQRGVVAAAGSACGADQQNEPSHVLRAIGLTDEEAQASVRFSLGRHTTASDINQAVAVVAEVARD